MKKLLIKSILVISVLCAVSCSDTKKSETTSSNQDNESIKKVNAVQEVVLYSVISDLNVRDEAGREGKVIDKLKYGQKALYLLEETDYKEKIIMRGRERIDTWKKIKFSNSDGSGANEGWVYGGGMLEEDKLFVEVQDSLFERTLENVSNEELSQLIGMTISPDFTYNGKMSYTRTSELKGSQLQKHGSFKVVGLPKDRSGEMEHVRVEYSGSFELNEAEGEFVENFKGYEGEAISTIMFVNGKCSWSEVEGNAEGEEIKHRIEDPERCNFQFIRDHMSRQ